MNNKEIEICTAWIQRYTTTQKGINYSRNSYGLKHAVERWSGTYVSNEAFKAAAAKCGLMAVPCGRQNEYYNIYIKKQTK
jgi:hypothetical protein